MSSPPRSPASEHFHRYDALVADLNALLDALSLSSARLVLEAVQDLTPSLILAILESMLRARLPIPQATRDARDKSSKVDAMKIFLGVLEADVLQEEIGLADVDPRRLATGEWEEVLFVGRVLVWLARRMGYLPSSSKPPSPVLSLYEEPLAESSVRRQRPPMHAPRDSVTTNGTAGSFTNPFIVRAPSPMPSSHPSRTPSPTQDTALGLSFDPPRASSPPPARHDGDNDDEEEQTHDATYCSCAHGQDPDASFASSATYCTCAHDEPTHRSHPATSVRYDGWIQRVEDVQSFEASRARTTPRARRSRELESLYPAAFRDGSALPDAGGASSSRRYSDVTLGVASLSLGAGPSRPARNPTRHVSPAQHTLALMNERARLLAELASVKAGRRRTGAG